MRLPISVSAPQAATALRRATLLVATVSALVLAGCATQSENYGAAQVAMEDDGLPAQIPPLRRAKPEQDDPSEPFSLNYGPPPQVQNNKQPSQIPEDLPKAFRRKLMDSVSIS